MHFPRMVYRSASDHKAVETAEQHSEALAEGWFDSVPEAQSGKAATPVAAAVKKVEDLGTTVAAAPAKAAKESKKAAAAAATTATPPPAEVKQPEAAAPAKNPWD